MTHVPFGPTGEIVYKRTYSRKKADGTNETWPETVIRVAQGNMALVHGPDFWAWPDEAVREYDELRDYMLDFRIIPAGRHLWASGVKGRQYLFNCHVAGWGEKLSRHFEFTFLRLMEGGGVGSNYSSEFLKPYGAPRRQLNVHIVCDPGYPDYQEMLDTGVLSTEYDSDWVGSFSVEDSREGWSAALVDLIDTYMTDDEVKHENRVYDVSRVRWKGARLKTFGGTASGPMPFARMMLEVGRVLNGGTCNCAGAWMHSCHENNPEGHAVGCPRWGWRHHVTPLEAMEIDHAIAECVVSGGVRRSARMAMLPWNDPFIFEFCSAKVNSGKHWTTNISVIVDDEFCEALNYGDKTMRAYRVHEKVVKGMLTNGEPGYWHIDNANVGEPNRVIATNPCGEIALEAWENCNLGHVNLEAFASAMPELPGGDLEKAHRLMTRFLMRATYGDVNDEEQGEVLARNRRIGVGHLGVQGFLAKRGVRYSEAPRGDMYRFPALLQVLRSVVRDEAVRYAHELRIPVPVKMTTVAPTGSIAKLPGVAEGIHPIYARFFERRVRFSSGTDQDQYATVWEAILTGLKVETDQYDATGNTEIVVYPTKEKLVAEVEALGFDPDIVESADELTLEQMLAFQAMYQKHWADNAVSFTINVPEGRYTQDELSDALAAYLPVLKGSTVMVDGTRPQAPYTRITREQYEESLVRTVADGTDEDCANGACPVR